MIVGTFICPADWGHEQWNRGTAEPAGVKSLGVIRLMEIPDKKNIEDILALTPLQEGMLFHYLKEPGSRMNVEQVFLEMSGKIEFELFREAWQSVVNTNEMLRTVFRWDDVKKPVQLVLKEHCTVLRYFDLTIGDGNLEVIINRDRDEIFDLQDVPFRVTLCKLAEIGAGQYKYGMIITNHHILYDGWSNGIILEEFFYTYDALWRGRIPRKLFKTKFKEYVKWLHGQDREEQASFWKKYLRGLEHLEGKAHQEKKPTNTIKNSSTRRIKFPAEQAAKLEALCKKYRISLSSFFYCVWGLLLLQYNRRGDLLFDTTVSGRSAEIKGIEAMVGLFINTLPVRINMQPGENVLDMLQRISMMMLRRQEFEPTSLLFIKKQLAGYDIPRTLFDSVVVIENYPLDVKSLLENRAQPFSVDSAANNDMTTYDLSVLITLSGDNEITAEFTFDNTLFDQNSIAVVTGHFVSLSAEMLEYPWKLISAIEIPEGEKEALWYCFENRCQAAPGVMYVAPADEEPHYPMSSVQRRMLGQQQMGWYQ